MSKWDKLTAKICNLSSNVRFDKKDIGELRIYDVYAGRWQQSLYISKRRM